MTLSLIHILRGLENHRQHQQYGRQVQVPAECPSLQAQRHLIEDLRQLAAAGGARQQYAGQDQADIGQAAGKELLVRHHQRHGAVAIEGQQLVQACLLYTSSVDAFA